MLTGIFGLVVFVMKLWPAVSSVRWLHRVLVEAPLALAGRVTRKDLILIGLILFGGQIVMLLGPEAALVYILDLSFYAEAVVATTLAATTARLGSGWQSLKRIVGGLKRVAGRPPRAMRRRPRARRTRSAPSRRSGACNDDDPSDASIACAA